MGALIFLALTIWLLFSKREGVATKIPLEKSIAVLPFKNDSGDTSNIYVINGLMEAIMNNLQKIEDLKVVSRTTVEKYRDKSKSIAELSEELQVSYFIEGSGQKIGDDILLSIQLIEAHSDRHIWANRYERKMANVFQLQTEVALNVANEIEVVIMPEERQRIEKQPTENPVAYDLYLEGLGKTTEKTEASLQEAIEFFKKAVKEDEQFAPAYAYIAICYYYLDIFQTEKKYGSIINTYADKALLIDGEQGHGLVAKALYYMQDEQYELAIQFLEKVLVFYPNDAWAHNFLSDIYVNYLPDTEKYLTHAIQGIQRTTLDQDSFTASNSYLHLSNALAQNGFIKEAEGYLQRSLDFNPNNIYSKVVRAYIHLAKNANFQNTQTELLNLFQIDSNNLLVVQEVAKVYYAVRDYESTWKYYEKFLAIKDA